MLSQSGRVLNDLFQNAYKIGETNLEMQREMFFGWSRLWPALFRQPAESVTPLAHVRDQWSHTMQEIARRQRELLAQEFDVALKTFDLAFGNGEPSNGAPATKEAPRPAAVAKPAPPVAPPVPVAVIPDPREIVGRHLAATRNIAHKVAVVTGAASGIGEAVARELALRGAKAVLMVDRSEHVHDVVRAINESVGRTVAITKLGDTTDAAFRKRLFDEAREEYGVVTICVPAAGITRDGLAVRVDKETGKAHVYPMDTFRQVTEVNLIAPIYWAMEMVARIAEDRRERGLKRWEPEEEVQGAVVFLGSVSSQGNKGQISYAVAKAGLEGAAATLMKEAIFHGVRCGIIHPGFTDTPMAKALGEDFLAKNVLPYTQLRRLIRPDEIADAICFMISNSAVSGELWADAGWHPPA